MTLIPESLYTVAEAAEYMKCSTAAVYKLIAAEEITVLRVGAKKGYRFTGSDLADFVEFRKTGGPAPRGTFKHLKLS